MQAQIAGLPWFEEDDYESFRKLLQDRQWHVDFAHWERAANQTLERLEDQGIVAVKAHVRSDTFAQWCRDTGCNVESRSLLAFANDHAARIYREQNLH